MRRWIEIGTTASEELIDITARASTIVKQSGIPDGLCGFDGPRQSRKILWSLIKSEV